jgi:hypothetical protein
MKIFLTGKTYILSIFKKITRKEPSGATRVAGAYA